MLRKARPAAVQQEFQLNVAQKEKTRDRSTEPARRVDSSLFVLLWSRGLLLRLRFGFSWNGFLKFQFSVSRRITITTKKIRFLSIGIRWAERNCTCAFIEWTENLWLYRVSAF